MSDLSNAAGQIRTWAQRLSWMTELAGELDRIQNIESAAAEASSRLTTVRAELGPAEEALQRAKAALEQAQGDASAAIASAQAQAAQIVQAAQEKTEADRQAIIAAATQDADQRKRKADADVADVEAKRQQTVVQLDAAKAELAEVQGGIAAARESVRGLFGAQA